MLYLVATPIGNMSDISLRALEVLREVDFVISEDTRKTGVLLKKFEIKKKQISFHEHNEKQAGERIISLLKEGKEVALVGPRLRGLSPQPAGTDRQKLGRLDGLSAPQAHPICPWVDGLLRHLGLLSPDPRVGRLAAPAHTHVLLEAVAQAAHQDTEAVGAGDEQMAGNQDGTQ